jgi:hypothetical protein
MPVETMDTVPTSLLARRGMEDAQAEPIALSASLKAQSMLEGGSPMA